MSPTTSSRLTTRSRTDGTRGHGNRDGGTLTWTAPVIPPPTITDVSEVEPNDTPGTAQQVGTNVNVSGKAKDSDGGADGGFGGEDVEDWYAFQLTAPTFVTIHLSGFKLTSDFDLLLYTTSGPFNWDNASSGNGSGEEEDIEAVFPPGNYVVAVSAFDGGVPTLDNYKLSIVAAPKVIRYNVYCGVGTVTPSTDSFFGTAPGDATSFPIGKSSPGSVYVVTAVLGVSQGAASNTASLGDCEGGPTIASTKLKLKKNGNLTINGSGFAAGATILLNGSAVPSTYKVKKGGTVIKAKGPLASGSPYSSVVTAGQPYVVTIITAEGGCTSFTAPPALQ